MKLSIVYRIYPKVSKVPPIYSDNKLKLSELCLKSFKAALGNIEAKIWIILDNCPDEYKQMLDEILSGYNYEFIEVDGIGNGQTFKMQLEILSAQSFSEYVYFAEDDYFYLPNSIEMMLNTIMSNNEIHFLTPYNHLDYYQSDFHNYHIEHKYFNNKEWKKVNSTCMTFMSSKKVINECYTTLQTYSNNNWDNSMFMTITGINATNFSLMFKSVFNSTHLFKSYIKQFLHTPIKALFGKRFNLFAPEESIATHMDSNYLAPQVNWQEEFAKIK